MTILTGQEIRDSDIIVSECIDKEIQIQPAGLDLTVYKIESFQTEPKPGVIDFDNSEREIPPLDEYGFYIGANSEPKVFLPQGIYKMHLHPILKIPDDYIAFALPRSSVVRIGCGIHTGFWDPGYTGDSQILFEVYNPAGAYIYKDARIVQIVFMRMGQDAETLYNGVYQGQGIKVGAHKLEGFGQIKELQVPKKSTKSYSDRLIDRIIKL